jgi:peptidoglycan/LPS O-acetylase OafA/YrhL
MTGTTKNSFDLLRLLAASLVLYSHQHVLLGVVEPSFFGMTTLGGAGVSIFFFLSGLLVWTSWTRDPDLWRFFLRRSLRIFPALWVVVVITVFVFGPLMSSVTFGGYFASSETWRYLTTAVLLVRYSLPGVFDANPYPAAVNGSLWTLPVEFLCYVSVALVGSFDWLQRSGVAVGLFIALLAVELGPLYFGSHLAANFEMAAFFWWGVWYGYMSSSSVAKIKWNWMITAVAMLVFVSLGARGVDRTGMLVFAAALVMLAQRWTGGARVTDPVGDLSYGMYIFAFPVQQWLAQTVSGHESPFGLTLLMAFVLTASLSYVSWHLIEKRALRFKPRVRGPHEAS